LYNGSAYQTTTLPAATSITSPFTLSGTYTGSNTVKNVVLGFDGATLVTAASTTIGSGAFSLSAPTGTTINKIEIRQVDNTVLASLSGTWSVTTSDITVSPATNTPPTISNIIQNPSRDIMSTTTVSVNADVIDDDTVELVQLKWGTTSEEYTNVINMIIAAKGTYQTETNIPAQANGTTIYYIIYAEDNDGDVTTSPQLSYTVRDPATTTLPYTQDFSAGWGNMYTYDVSGTKPWYIYNNDNASCNGYSGSSEEEHWLVLPGINFDNYTGEEMTFNTIATYGVIDENNYLKLLYSPNYLGMGNPYATGVTWTEIPFTTGTIGGGETSSGILNLSGISGTNVYLAFKYYSTDNATRWEVDDINIYFYDIPEGSPVTIGSDVVEITGGSANIVTGDIPPVNNNAFVASSNFILDLLGAGPWHIEIQTTALWGAYYFESAWHSVAANGEGKIIFNVPNAKGVLVPIVLGEEDPTLPVELSSFTAVLTSDMYVRINWIAESETNHSGYNILRAEKKDLATAQKINARLIDDGIENGTQIDYTYTDFETYSNMVYYYWLESVSLDGISDFYGPLTITIGDPTQEPNPPTIPMVTKLLNAYPNPFNPNTNIRYSLKDAGKVRIDIYNMKGQMINSLTAEHDSPGFYQIAWDGCDANGKPVSSGIYMYKMISGNYLSAKKMILAK
ncbi:MAG TPA: FlgD immunoglobulin-like domain containing protein, partial [Candidatus Cloacimonas sp.]|nr:FlgD immunoglobulin-like domain containing protein [Candidatus Cloacimonas sp.]